MHSLDERPHDVGYDFWTEIIGALSSLSLEYKKRQKKEKKRVSRCLGFYTLCVSLSLSCFVSEEDDFENNDERSTK